MCSHACIERSAGRMCPNACPCSHGSCQVCLNAPIFLTVSLRMAVDGAFSLARFRVCIRSHYNRSKETKNQQAAAAKPSSTAAAAMLRMVLRLGRPEEAELLLLHHQQSSRGRRPRKRNTRGQNRRISSGSVYSPYFSVWKCCKNVLDFLLGKIRIR